MPICAATTRYGEHSETLGRQYHMYHTTRWPAWKSCFTTKPCRCVCICLSFSEWYERWFHVSFFFTRAYCVRLLCLLIFVELRVLLSWCLVRRGSWGSCWLFELQFQWYISLSNPFNVFLCSCVLIFAYSSVALFSMSIYNINVMNLGVYNIRT